MICVKNLTKEQILKKVEMLRDASGEKARRRLKMGVVTHSGPGGGGMGGAGGVGIGAGDRGSVRGVWSPFHQNPERRWKI